MKEKTKKAILEARKKLEIPEEVEIVLSKTKEVPVYALLSSYDYRINNDGRYTGMKYIINYRKSISPDILKHELCHLKLHLIGLPIFHSKGSDKITGQVLDTLHEDFYSGVIMASLFREDFTKKLDKILKSDHVEEHFYKDDNSMAWVLTNYILNKSICDERGLDKYSEALSEKLDHLLSVIDQDLSLYLKEIEGRLNSLPKLESLKPLTSGERDSIINVMLAIDKIGRKVLSKMENS